VKRHRLVLTDCHMPVLDGFDLARTIRAEEDQRSKTSIIAITANALRGEADRCHQAGMDDVLTKPVQLDVLRENLVKWLGLAESRQALFRVPAADPAIPGERRSPPADPRFDAGALTRVVGITDIAELAGYYDEFLRLNDDAMRDLRAAYASADRSAVQALAHKLKSSARTVGANAVAQCYDEIEHAAKAADWSGIAEPLSRLETCVTEAKTLIDRTVRVSQ
jgi:CheY-like chemotaxis protein